MSQSIDRITKLIIVGVLLILNFIISFIYPSQSGSIASTILLFILVFQLYRLSPIGILLISPLLFLQLSVQVSLNAIEFGSFMKEMARYGAVSSASSAYSCSVAIFLVCSILTFKSLNSRFSATNNHVIQIQPKLFALCGPMLLISAILYLLFKGTLTGFPLLAGFDRFQYRFSIGDPILLNLLILKLVLAAFLGVSTLSLVKSRRWISHLIFVTYIGVSFLFGDKFFGIITAFLFYGAVLFTSEPENIKRYEKPFIFLLFSASFLGLLFTYYIYSDKGQVDFVTSSEKIFERFAEQGQLWYVHFNESFTWIDFQYDDVKLNIQSVFERYGQNFAYEKRIGAFFFMPKYAPYNMFMSFSRNGGTVTPTMSFEPYLTYLFGYLGALVFVGLLGIILGNILFWIFKSISARNPFNILLPVFILTQFVSMINSGTFYLLLGPSSLKAYLAFLTLSLLVNTTINKYRVYSTNVNTKK